MNGKKIMRILLASLILLLACGEKKDDFRERLNYFNSKYMFRITFPENWLNYSTFEIDEIIDPEIKVKTICFTLPTRSRDWQPVDTPNGFASLFYLRIFTKEQWTLFMERYGSSLKEINSVDRKIGESKDTVFMIKNATSIPVDLYLFMKDVNAITGTFRIVIRE